MRGNAGSSGGSGKSSVASSTPSHGERNENSNRNRNDSQYASDSTRMSGCASGQPVAKDSLEAEWARIVSALLGSGKA